jgi:hypothetical protein
VATQQQVGGSAAMVEGFETTEQLGVIQIHTSFAMDAIGAK